jgi:DNA-binding response OmpR family regulator
LDITLPDSNGYELYQKIKKERNIPVIFLTALDEEKNIIKGLELGADDYITKPFHARELLLRIKNVLRHTKQPNEEELLHLQNVTINLDKAKVFRNQQEVEMTALEYKILVLLGENQGRIISRGQILANIWDNNENYVNDNTLTVYIKRIREKIEEDPNHPKIIQTVRGLGYKIKQGKGLNDEKKGK